MKQDKHAKLLGVTIDDTQKWETQIYGTGGLLKNLNSRLFMVKRLSKDLNKESLVKIADSLYTSKVRYGLSLYGKVRVVSEDSETQEFKDIQKHQNQLLRFLNNSRVSDKISSKSILNKFNMLSINQINAQIKLSDMWKANNLENYPIKIEKHFPINNSATTRASTFGKLIEKGSSRLTKDTQINDATHLWNIAPNEIKLSASVYSAKKAIKEFVKKLPM